MIIIQNIIDSKYQYQSGWVMVVIVLSVMIIGYLFSAFHSRFISLLRAFFTTRLAEQLAKEDHSIRHPASILLSINFLLTSALFLTQALSSEGSYSLSQFLMLAGAISAVYLGKIISLKILGFIFDQQRIVNEYVFIIFLANQVIGIGFIPIIIFMAYGKEVSVNAFMYAGIGLFISAFIIRIGKGIMMFLSAGKISPVYLFLYLCTLEILPLVLGLKLLEKWS